MIWCKFLQQISTTKDALHCFKKGQSAFCQFKKGQGDALFKIGLERTPMFCSNVMFIGIKSLFGNRLFLQKVVMRKCLCTIFLYSLIFFLNYLQINALVFIFHIVIHLISVSLNPADINVRAKANKGPLPKFDRSKHSHVIENDFCHICEVKV